MGIYVCGVGRFEKRLGIVDFVVYVCISLGSLLIYVINICYCLDVIV